MIQRPRLMRFALSSFLFLSLSACVGPMVVQETARTVGDGNVELSAAYSTGSQWAAKINYGLSKDWDLGLQVEGLSMGIRAKYAFVNVEKGWSYAAAGGIGSSIGGSHYYGDFIASHMDNYWEPYTSIRVVHMKIDPVEFKDEKTGQTDFTVDLPNYNYGQYFLGTRYWIDKNWMFSLEGSYMFAIGDGLRLHKSFFVSAGTGYRF